MPADESVIGGCSASGSSTSTYYDADSVLGVRDRTNIYSVAADDTQPVTSVDDLGANLYALEAKDHNAGSSVGDGHDYAVVAVQPRQPQGHDYAAGDVGSTGEVYSVLAEDDGAARKQCAGGHDYASVI